MNDIDIYSAQALRKLFGDSVLKPHDLRGRECTLRIQEKDEKEDTVWTDSYHVQINMVMTRQFKQGPSRNQVTEVVVFFSSGIIGTFSVYAERKKDELVGRFKKIPNKNSFDRDVEVEGVLVLL